jgi:hypothetical protein
VFLPYEQFQQLWKQAQEALRTEPDQPPPVAALINQIDSEAVVGEQVVQVTARLKLELLSPGWHEIPLRLADASIQSARLGDQPARLLIATGRIFDSGRQTGRSAGDAGTDAAILQSVHQDAGPEPADAAGSSSSGQSVAGPHPAAGRQGEHPTAGRRHRAACRPPATRRRSPKRC